MRVRLYDISVCRRILYSDDRAVAGAPRGRPRVPSAREIGGRFALNAPVDRPCTALGRSTGRRRSRRPPSLVHRAAAPRPSPCVDHRDSRRRLRHGERIGSLPVLVNDVWGAAPLRVRRQGVGARSGQRAAAAPPRARHPPDSRATSCCRGGNAAGWWSRWTTAGTAALQRQEYRVNMFYDLAKNAIVSRMAGAVRERPAPPAVRLTPGWRRLERCRGTMA